ncbi:AAA family ATPase [Hyphococcus sp.]|uniref:AAA family ATPase n=1 Tax=Hyphococcus sp. TaxID=2038636 RepID=UPI003CCB781B
MMKIDIPLAHGSLPIELEEGQTAFIVGANGSGKSRLAAYLEKNLGMSAHRISAQRNLFLNLELPKTSQEVAENVLVGGHARTVNPEIRSAQRWGRGEVTRILNDFDALIQTLFADHLNVTTAYYDLCKKQPGTPPPPSRMTKLVAAWKAVHPHRKLEFNADKIFAVPVTNEENNDQARYEASELSDGERATFYLLGQVLCARPGTLIIIDEPELHIHRSVHGKLWDEVESLRDDCYFLVISHDIEFVSGRQGKKYVAKSFTPGATWDVEELNEDEWFSEETLALILGSRRPILLIEGSQSNTSDYAIYRRIYKEWTVLPRNSCTEIIHAVASFRRNPQLTRVHCAGLIDADSYSPSDIEYFQERGIYCLPVCEIENLYAHPKVLAAIAQIDKLPSAELQERQSALLEWISSFANDDKVLSEFLCEHVARRIDHKLKKIDLSGISDPSDIAPKLNEAIEGLSVESIVEERKSLIIEAVRQSDLSKLLSLFSHKGIVAKTSSLMRKQNVAEFKTWFVRMLGNDEIPALRDALSSLLPKPE